MTMPPKVQVSLTTYNHGAYIAQAIESILSQRTTFEFQVIVGDDCSSDQTASVIRDYERRFPDRITTLLYAQHKGLHHPEQLFRTVMGRCTAPFVALLEGDDYWTSPDKLQTQIDFLERHPECSFCYHPVSVSYADGRRLLWPPILGAGAATTITIEDFLRAEPWPEIPTASVVFRRSALKPLPDWFVAVLNGDTALQLLLAHEGSIGFVDACMAAHRKHAGGVSRAFEDEPEAMSDMALRLLLQFDAHFEGRYHELVSRHIAYRWRAKAFAHRRRGEYSQAIGAFVRGLQAESGDWRRHVRRCEFAAQFALPLAARRQLRRVVSALERRVPTFH